jgi:hypothetical protein
MKYYSEHRSIDPDGIERLAFLSTRDKSQALKWAAKRKGRGTVKVWRDSGKNYELIFNNVLEKQTQVTQRGV